MQNQNIWRNRTQGGKLKACRHAVGSSAVDDPDVFLQFNIHSDIHFSDIFLVQQSKESGAESSEAGCGTLQLLQLLVCSVGHALYSSSRRLLFGGTA